MSFPVEVLQGLSRVVVNTMPFSKVNLFSSGKVAKFVWRTRRYPSWSKKQTKRRPFPVEPSLKGPGRNFKRGQTLFEFVFQALLIQSLTPSLHMTGCLDYAFVSGIKSAITSNYVW